MAPTALLSVSNKEGLLPLAKALTNNHGFKLISSGGTAQLLEEASIPVTRVADYTGAPEILGGRVKTLHPRIHGGILAKRKDPKHQSELETLKINEIDLVVVNLYPFQETVVNPNVSWESAIEKIDIGGPTMVRAAAKNHAFVTILTNPNQYEDYIKALNDKTLNEEKRCQFALQAFEHTASYDIAISKWIAERKQSNDSPWLSSLALKQSLRYGENPHQKASWFSHPNEGWGAAKQLLGKELSTNNLLDLEAALGTIREFGYAIDGVNSKQSKAAAVVVKHTNPCGVATGNSLKQALKSALDADRVSAFGGIVALNRAVDSETAIELKTLFLECVVAPNFDTEAIEILSEKSNLRLIQLNSTAINSAERKNIRSILGGILVQDQDDEEVNTNDWLQATKRYPSNLERLDLDFAWRVVKHVRSNAIVVVSGQQTLGIGAGQMNRVGSAKLALEAAGEKAKGATLASDGFFPFDDTVRLAAEYGIKAIIQPGGSIRDKDSIKACDELDISMVMTGKRHFLH